MENLQRLTERVEASFRTLGESRFGGLSQSLGALERRMTAITSSAERMGAAFTESTEVMTSALVAATASIGALAAEMRAVAAATARIGVPGAAAPGGRGPGTHGSRIYAPLDAGPIRGHAGVGLGVGAGLLTGFGLFEGLKLSAQEQRAYMYATLADEVDPRSPRGQMLMQMMRSSADDASIGTIFSRAAVAKTMPAIVGMTGQRAEDVMPMMAPAIRFAEFTRQLGANMNQTWDPTESAAALIRLAHSMGITDPARMEAMANLMVPAVQTGHTSPQRLVNVLQYMTSPARGLGMTDRETIELGGVGSLLFPGTRAGTNIGMMLQKIEQVQAGPLPGASRQQLRHLEFLTKSMVSMGLVDPNTHMLFRDDAGGIVGPLLENLRQYQYTHPGTAAGIFQQVFETRGGRAAFELGQGNVPSLFGQISRREDAFAQLGGVRGAQQAGMEGLTNQVQRAYAQLQNVLGDLADPLVPSVTNAFKGLANALEMANKFLPQHPTVAATISSEAALGGLWAALKMGSKFIPGLARFIPGTQGFMLMDALQATGMMTGSLFPHEGLDDFDQRISRVPQLMGRWGNRIPGFGGHVLYSNMKLPTVSSTGDLLTDPGLGEWPFSNRQRTLGGGMRIPGAPEIVNHNQVTLNVSVHGVTLGELVQKVIAAIVPLLHNALTNNTGVGAGHHESPFTSGMMTPLLP